MHYSLARKYEERKQREVAKETRFGNETGRNLASKHATQLHI